MHFDDLAPEKYGNQNAHSNSPAAGSHEHGRDDAGLKARSGRG
jgi:hypothetical protein